MNIKFPFWLLICSGFCCFGQQSDNPMKSTLDSTVNKFLLNYMKENKRVGVSVGIIFNGYNFIYNYGETSPGSGILPTAKSVYEIGSITKTFTGLLVAHAITEKKISLNDDIRKFLPGNYPNLQYLNAELVKIAYLLAHTAQFPNSFIKLQGSPVTENDFLDSLHQIRLDSLKEFKYNYSNVGYQVLGLILEKVYHRSYAALIDSLITSPLGMPQTRISYLNDKDNVLLSGYDENKQPAKPAVVTLPAAGALDSTVGDMLQYLRYQNREETPEVRLTHRIISGDVDREAYGFQWAVGKTWNWDQYIRIDGGTKGFRSFCVLYPLRQIGIVLLSNQTDGTAGVALYKIATAIYNSIKKTAN